MTKHIKPIFLHILTCNEALLSYLLLIDEVRDKFKEEGILLLPHTFGKTYNQEINSICARDMAPHVFSTKRLVAAIKKDLSFSSVIPVPHDNTQKIVVCNINPHLSMQAFVNTCISVNKGASINNEIEEKYLAFVESVQNMGYNYYGLYIEPNNETISKMLIGVKAPYGFYNRLDFDIHYVSKLKELAVYYNLDIVSDDVNNAKLSLTLLQKLSDRFKDNQCQ